jgi:hypothetical protein
MRDADRDAAQQRHNARSACSLGFKPILGKRADFELERLQQHRAPKGHTCFRSLVARRR